MSFHMNNYFGRIQNMIFFQVAYFVPPIFVKHVTWKPISTYKKAWELNHKEQKSQETKTLD